MSERRVLFACDLDSQIFGALPPARAFRARGWRTTFAIDAGVAPPKTLLDDLSSRFEVVDRPLCAIAATEEAFDYDAIGVFATGSRIAQFRHALELATHVFERPRPALFCGFNGLVYEKFEEGVAWRLGYDRLCLNGHRDAEAFAAFVAGTPFAGQPTAIVGLRRRPDEPVRSSKPAKPAGSRKFFVFAEQVVVPAEQADRAQMVATLARLAAASTDWDVVIKGRVRPNERTFHEHVGRIDRLVAALPSRPANLSLSYEPLDGLLQRADLFATVSSTALFDALDFGVPALITSDFGIRNGFGSHVFLGSGLMTALGELRSLDEAPRLAPDQSWLQRVGYAAHSPDKLIDELERFDHAAALPPAFYSFEAAAKAAGPWGVHSQAVLAARAEILDALASGDRAAARGELSKLAEALAASDRRRAIDAAWRLREGRTAALARRLGLYWAYRRARTRLLGEAPR